MPTTLDPLQDSNSRVLLLNAATSADPTGNNLHVGRSLWSQNSIQIVNADSATVSIYISADGTNWIKYGTDITTTTAYITLPYGGVYPFVRAERDASTTGSVTVILVSSAEARR